ncbi:MAG: UbiD family decarboxylase [Eubacteriales bacterium]|nr:UbiD family decarboxylase [Eubacteriales bacterium]
MNHRTDILDLRTALEVLRKMPGQLIETHTAVNPEAELSGVYRYVGAGGTVMRPTKVNGPAMLFHNVTGHPDAKVLIGLLASRERVGTLLGCKKEDLGKLLCECAQNPIEPIVTEEAAPCQEVIYRAEDPGFDLFQLIPAPTNTPLDAGLYITMGMCYATHPDTGRSDVTIHRMCIQSKDELSIFLQPGSRHIGAMAERGTELGQPLPISISIGVDPAIEIGSCFEPPTTPLGYNELAIAGAIRQQPVRLCPCVSIRENAIANAEYVIEGEILPGVKVVEDQNSHTGYAMPEFPGYNGRASKECWLIKVKAVTTRKHPIMQTVIGPSEEHVNLAGIPTEASIYQMVEKALPGKVTNVYAHAAGGGKYMAVLQCQKTVPTDEGKQRQAALLAFSAFPELKHVILVDEDVDIFDSNDVLWAMNTRFQGDRDIITIPGVRCHPLDPSSDPAYAPSITDRGISCKTIFDCTVPFHLKERFQRAQFLEVDPERWLKG